MRRFPLPDGSETTAETVQPTDRDPGSEHLGTRRLGGPQVVEETQHGLGPVLPHAPSRASASLIRRSHPRLARSSSPIVSSNA